MPRHPPCTKASSGDKMIEVTEVSIAELRAALESGRTTAVELVEAYLARIDAYDGPDTATRLNAVVVRNPEALQEAAASDARRARGETLGPLDGIPYTAKDSYLVKGLTAASGSPAFKDLVAQRDAFTIERLRAAGARAVFHDHALAQLLAQLLRHHPRNRVIGTTSRLRHHQGDGLGRVFVLRARGESSRAQHGRCEDAA